MDSIDDVVDSSTSTYNDSVKNYINDKLILTIDDIDDLAIAWIVKIEENNINFFILNDKGKFDPNIKITQEIPKWLWRKGGKHGNGSENITQYFHDYHNELFSRDEKLLSKKFIGYLVIAVYDFPYNSKLLPGGKWSFSAKLEKNGKKIWSNSNFKPSQYNKKGLQYLKIFSLKTNKRKFIINETISEDAKIKIYKYVMKNHNYVEITKDKYLKKEEQKDD